MTLTICGPDNHKWIVSADVDILHEITHTAGIQNPVTLCITNAYHLLYTGGCESAVAKASKALIQQYLFNTAADDLLVFLKPSTIPWICARP